ncbi:2-amino-4-hydroxy-6-hydroxymethyldihydropteridine pyrophosphokinase [Paenibacillus sp. 32O-W]|jgi:2-amino-4-hydroxy-6-hydroxymethyldihydropteridine pyrophosphokinase|nr:2-amino-4-hydroxy-6-hydroxymethyldihydropteridine pyrophosphokinase [Paenibacillus sp. 32O-W]
MDMSFPSERSPQDASGKPAGQTAKRGAAYVALGSNLGDRERSLFEALQLLNEHPAADVLRVSPVYETDPVGYTQQPAFLNMVAAVRTSLTPRELLRLLLDIERKLGRVRDVRWGPRTIDLDLLLYDDRRFEDDELTLPHPRMMERAFVLVPLRDVLHREHPLYNQVAELAADALRDGKEGIALWNTINWHNAFARFEN